MTKVIVFGSFDPLHKGHLNLFQQARALGDYLVVVVASGEKIRILKNREPRHSEEDRIAAISKVSEVDDVVLSDENDTYTILGKIMPDIIALGYDQKIPEEVFERLGDYQTVILKSFKPDIYKSSLLATINN